MDSRKELEVDTFAHREDVRDELADVLEEIEVEDLTVDGICGVY
jgi:mycofactocin precursor